jgi:hypothetical protein
MAMGLSTLSSGVLYVGNPRYLLGHDHLLLKPPAVSIGVLEAAGASPPFPYRAAFLVLSFSNRMFTYLPSGIRPTIVGLSLTYLQEPHEVCVHLPEVGRMQEPFPFRGVPLMWAPGLCSASPNPFFIFFSSFFLTTTTQYNSFAGR